jgi:hypothetical protein
MSTHNTRINGTRCGQDPPPSPTEASCNPALVGPQCLHQPWSSYLQFIQTFNEAKTNPHLRLQEDFHISDIWESSVKKLQALISRAESARRRLELWKTDSRERRPLCIGMVYCAPAWSENRMNNVAFRTAFQLRNLITRGFEEYRRPQLESKSFPRLLLFILFAEGGKVQISEPQRNPKIQH